MKKYMPWIVIGIIVFVGMVITARAQGPSLPPGEYDLETGQYVFNVPALSATDTPVAPTDTPIPPTATPIPPTPVPGGTIEPFASASLCPSHNDTEFHRLWDGVRGCHYDHEHGNGPDNTAAQAVFGDWTQYTGGQEISYPWAPMDESTNKHEGYTWDFRDFRGQSCDGVRIRAMMFQAHMGGTSVGGRDHSFFGMFLVRDCAAGTEGLAFVGGFQDFGQGVSWYDGEVLALSSNPQPSYSPGSKPYRAHGCFPDPANTLPGCRNPNMIWTSMFSGSNDFDRPEVQEHQIVRTIWRVKNAHTQILGSSRDKLDAIVHVFVCDDGSGGYDPVGCKATSSRHGIGHVNLFLQGFSDPNLNTFADVRGVVDPSCSIAGPDCVPLVFVNVPVGSSVGYGNIPGSANSFERNRQHDIYFCSNQSCFDVPFGQRDPLNGVPSGWIGAKN